MLEALYPWLSTTHLVAGSLALLAFWVQAFGRKGGARHRWTGRVYTAVMAVVLATGAPMTVVVWQHQGAVAGAFLGFLLFVTALALCTAVMYARLRQRRIGFQRRVVRVFDLVSVVVSAAILATGWGRSMVLVALGIFGIVASIGSLRTGLDSPFWRSWRVRHLHDTLGSGAAIHIAFLAFGLRSILGERYTGYHLLFAFVAPLVGMTIAAWRLGRRYRVPAPAAGESASDGGLGSRSAA